MTPKIKTWVIRPLIITVISLVTLIGVGVGILLLEQERIVNIAIREVNKQFKGELTVEHSKISLFKHFPSVGVVLNNAHFYPDKTKSGGAIFRFEKLYVGVSLTDLLNNKYNVRKLSLHDGRMDLVKDMKGSINLLEALNVHSDTTSTTDSTNSPFEIDLHQISFKALEFTYLDQSDGRRFDMNISELASTFKSDSALMAITLNTKMELDMTSPTDTSFFRHKQFEMVLEANYEKGSSLLHIPSSALKLEEATFNLTGSANIAKESVIDFRINGDKPDVNLITAFLPESVKASLAPFKYDGRIYFDGMVRGRVSKDQMPLIEVTFGCENAWFLNERAAQKVEDLEFQGYYYNGSDHALSTSELQITNVNARPGKGIFKGNFVMRDFTNPAITMQVNSELELKFLGEFFGINDIKQTTGKIKLDMDFKEVVDLNLPEQSLNKLKDGIQSKLVVENLSFSIPGHPLHVKNMNIHAEMSKGNITLDSASARIGDSDFKLSGSLSDIQAFIRDHSKAVTLKINARSKKILLKDIFAYDTALQHRMTEEIYGFDLGLELQTTVDELLHPAPLPKGQFDLKILNATLKNYKHSFKQISSAITVNDTLMRLKDLKGMVDNSDFQFSGRVTNYQLWFHDIKQGKTQIAFDFKSKRFALDDILGHGTRKYIPRGYRHEEANDVWVRSKIDLRYDTVFKFAKAHLANVTGVLKKHNFAMKDITGTIKYGTNRIFVLDTLKGIIGNSDFDVSMRLFNGADKTIKKRTNYFYFKSDFLDVDELVSYDFSPDTTRRKGDSTRRSKPRRAVQPTVAKADSSAHAKAFNIFTVPFAEFTVRIDVGKIKYNKLWMKDVTARVRMTENHHLFADTLAMKIAGGSVSMKGELNGSDTTKLFVTSVIKVDQVDLEKVMLKLDHFGQDVMINKNIKGRLSGQITSNVQIHPNFVPQLHNSTAQLDVKVYDGLLVDFAPMQAMAGYFKDKNLRLVRFDSLVNILSFNHGVLSIPSMNINSSLGAIELSGKQSFDLDMEYYMRIPMKMVTEVGFKALFEKKPGDVDATQVDEIEYSDKDKKIRFVNVKLVGTPDDFKVSLGKERKRS